MRCSFHPMAGSYLETVCSHVRWKRACANLRRQTSSVIMGNNNSHDKWCDQQSQARNSEKLSQRQELNLWPSVHRSHAITGRSPMKEIFHATMERFLEQYVSFGIPQGSILGSLLFIIYINGFSKCLRHTTPGTFADDTYIFTAHEDHHNWMFFKYWLNCST